MPNIPHMVWHQLLEGDVVLALALVLLPLALGCWLARRSGRAPFGRHTERIGGFAWNIGALLGLEQAYELGRAQVPTNRDVAFLHSYSVLDLEWRHGLFVEARIERFFLHWTAVMNTVDVFYAVGHAAGTIGILVWLYAKRREQYAVIRNLFMVATGLALVVFTLYPTAPPRMFPNYGFADPAELTHLVAAGGAQLSSYTYDPYAAMPSLHVTYAIIVGIALIVAERGRVWKVLGVVYPLAMAATVIISANHWILDVVGSCVTVGLSWALLLMAGSVRRALADPVLFPALSRVEVPPGAPLVVQE
jgi:hypothetical protein